MIETPPWDCGVQMGPTWRILALSKGIVVQRRQFIFSMLAAAFPAVTIFPATLGAAQENNLPLGKSRDEWRTLLGETSFSVLFEEATERAFSSTLNSEERDGKFVCKACKTPLFSSSTKYESGTGWPSFTKPIPGRVATKTDRTLWMVRTEYHCSYCGGHQGHVFEDGPEPTGQRWCNNGAALQFVPTGTPVPMTIK